MKKQNKHTSTRIILSKIDKKRTLFLKMNRKREMSTITLHDDTLFPTWAYHHRTTGLT